MDLQNNGTFVYDTLGENDKYSDEELITEECKEYYPELLEA
jgi:hypothetical protein